VNLQTRPVGSLRVNEAEGITPHLGKSSAASTLTMVNRESAEVTENAHKNVCRDSFLMLIGLKSEPNDFPGS